MIRGKGARVGWLGALALATLAGSLQAQQPAGQAPGAGRKVAAVVNGDIIPLEEVQVLLKQDTPSVHPLTEAQKREMYQTALDMLIDDCLMRQFLKRHTLPVSPAEVNKEMADLHQALNKKKQTLAQFCKETGQTEEQIRADIVARLQWQAYVTTQLPETKIKAYYDENKVFFDKVFVRASHILFRFPPNATDSEKQSLKAKLAALRVEILAGKIDFAQAARTYSDCPSKAGGGDIGQFPYKFADINPAFAKAAFAMSVGSVSDIVETEFGYHLIKVTERTPGEPSNFENIKDMVRFACAQEMELHARVLTEMRKTAAIEIPAQP